MFVVPFILPIAAAIYLGIRLRAHANMVPEPDERSEPAIPWLEVITLVALLIPFLGWVVGVVLLWLSPSWTTREKRIGTLLALGVGALALAALSSQVEWIRPPRDLLTDAGARGPFDIDQGRGCTIAGMQGPTFDVLGFLDEPRHPASVATVTGRGRPALATMWFLVEDDRLWFHTPETPELPSPFLRAARERAEVAVMVATFNPPADVRQVRTTGPARLEQRDDERVRRLYGRYVDTWSPKWERQATAASYHLWSMSPGRGMAVSYPGLEDGPAFRWSEPSGLFRTR